MMRAALCTHGPRLAPAPPRAARHRHHHAAPPRGVVRPLASSAVDEPRTHSSPPLPSEEDSARGNGDVADDAADGRGDDAAGDAEAETVRAPPGCRIYFAYGSNVNTKTMTGVRGIRPSAAYPAVLPDYKLVFTVPGLPYVEPGFASVTRVGPGDDRDAAGSKYEREVHGVAYTVTEDEWAYIMRTETSYLAREVTLTRCADGAAVAATTLVYPDVDVGSELLPSERYLGLLREGAVEWNLDEGWRRYQNETLAPYDPSAGSRAMGGAVAAASFVPLATLAVPLGVAVAAQNAGFGGEGRAAENGAGDGAGDGRPSLERLAEEAATQGFKALAGFTWGVHNALWAPVFGSGANNDDVPRGE